MTKTTADLIQRVSDGELSPEEAEAEAERLGLPPLRPVPDPSRFNPMDEAFWSLAMVLTWIATRQPDRVRDAWDSFRVMHWDWRIWEGREPPDGGLRTFAVLEQRGPMNFARLQLGASYREVVHKESNASANIHVARDALWAKLQHGDLTGFGVNAVTGQREAIPPVLWFDLHNFVENDRDFVRGDRSGVHSLRFDQLLFPTREVLACWPGGADLPGPPTKTGAPGRPTSKHLVAVEMDRRAIEGQLASKLAHEAAHLSAWLAKEHPGAPQMSAKTVANALREAYRAHKKA